MCAGNYNNQDMALDCQIVDSINLILEQPCNVCNLSSSMYLKSMIL